MSWRKLKMPIQRYFPVCQIQSSLWFQSSVRSFCLAPTDSTSELWTRLGIWFIPCRQNNDFFRSYTGRHHGRLCTKSLLCDSPSPRGLPKCVLWNESNCVWIHRQRWYVRAWYGLLKMGNNELMDTVKRKATTSLAGYDIRYLDAWYKSWMASKGWIFITASKWHVTDCP